MQWILFAESSIFAERICTTGRKLRHEPSRGTKPKQNLRQPKKRGQHQFFIKCWRNRRLFGTQRRGQNHHHANDRRLNPSHVRQRQFAWQKRSRQHPARHGRNDRRTQLLPLPVWAREPRLRRRNARRHLERARDRSARDGRLDRKGNRPRVQVFSRHEATPWAGKGALAQSQAFDARRTRQRTRPSKGSPNCATLLEILANKGSPSSSAATFSARSNVSPPEF